MTSYPKWGTQTLRELCFHACTGDIEKVQQCIKNGSMLSTDPEDDGMIKQELQHFICCPIGFYAAANGHMDILQLFIEKGHDITSVTDKNTVSPTVLLMCRSGTFTKTQGPKPRSG